MPPTVATQQVQAAAAAVPVAEQLIEHFALAARSSRHDRSVATGLVGRHRAAVAS